MSANSLRPMANRRRQRGLSIVELMVGLVVAMLVSIAAAGSAMMFTASQRQGIGVGGSGIGAATALAALMSGAYRPEPGERVAVLVCGANIAPDPFP